MDDLIRRDDGLIRTVPHSFYGRVTTQGHLTMTTGRQLRELNPSKHAVQKFAQKTNFESL